ncbi:hypothetical protein DAMA08_026180 [Martiniozyma asiatica (nom. inval.)]|nr:hypothetical protein DAMA08_026180 [Martiniozyma asiatica]
MNNINESILVCYSTQSGNSKKFANLFSKFLNENVIGESSTGNQPLTVVKNISEFESDVNLLANYRLVVYFISSYGVGEPCDDAIKFFENWENGNGNSNFKYSHYSLFGCGNSQYDDYQVIAKRLNKELNLVGATLIGEFGMCDEGIEVIDDTFDEWLFDYKNQLLAFLGKGWSLLDTQTYSPMLDIIPFESFTKSKSNANTQKPPYHQTNPFIGSIDISSTQIKNNKYVKSSINLEIEKSRQKYSTGDHIGIYPENNPLHVEQMLRILGLWGIKNSLVKILPVDRMSPSIWPKNPTSYFDLLLKYVEINNVLSRRFLKQLIIFLSENDAQKILPLINDKTKFKIEITDLKLTFVKFVNVYLPNSKFEIPLSFMLENLGNLKPRFLSIVSSGLKSPARADILVKLINEDSFTGVFSYWIENVTNGLIENQAAFFTRKSKFKLPVDVSKPIVLICSGTGIAPFKGFLDDLKGKVSKVHSIFLYYGLRTLNDDLIEIEEYREYAEIFSDKLTIKRAISRPDGANGKYVQDLLRDDLNIFQSLVDNNGYIYLCGDAKGMAHGVNKVLIDLFAKIKGDDLKGGDKYLSYMKSMGRYKEDVW